MASGTIIAEKQNALIRRLTAVQDERVLDEVGRFLDASGVNAPLEPLNDEEIEAVLRQLLEED